MRGYPPLRAPSEVSGGGCSPAHTPRPAYLPYFSEHMRTRKLDGTCREGGRARGEASEGLCSLVNCSDHYKPAHRGGIKLE